MFQVVPTQTHTKKHKQTVINTHTLHTYAVVHGCVQVAIPAEEQQCVVWRERFVPAGVLPVQSL